MRIISFAWTTPALVAGHKTCTRRDWAPGWAVRFQTGDLVAAYDRSPRYRGKQVAVVRLTARPYPESTRDAPETDYEAEGFAFLSKIGAKVDGMTPEALWRLWHISARLLYVVRFELVEVMHDHDR